MKKDMYEEDFDYRGNDGYQEFLVSIQEQFENLISQYGKKLLKADINGNLFEIYLENLPEDARQHYNCSACKKFVDKYGCLVAVKEDGSLESAVWNSNSPKFFAKSVGAMKQMVENSVVNAAFVTNTVTLGIPKTGIWSHMNLILPLDMVKTSRLKNANQMEAEKLEEFRMLMGAVQDYSLDIANQVVELLSSDTMYRSDRVLGIAAWFKEVCSVYEAEKDRRKRLNLIWKAVADAPQGFCHVKSSMIGTLLEDIASGMDYQIICNRFAEKMNPANYMRSKSAPTVGGIDQAEKIVAKLGIANSLKRRYAAFDEIPFFIWKNNCDKAKTEKKKIGEIFKNIIPKDDKIAKPVIPNTVMTWDKFQRTILPSTESIEVKIDNPDRLMALVTAADEDSENILQWDNSFSWYYHGGIDGEIKRRVEEAGGRYENNEIRCSLIWEGGTDLDIHCLTPDNFHIYYANKADKRNGWLDVDANGGSITTYQPVENIRWASNAPQGHYIFYVNNYQQRDRQFNWFKVELEVNGQKYTYNGTANDTGWKESVFEFDYRNGQVLKMRSAAEQGNSWNLDTNKFIKVNGITTSPNLWGVNPKEYIGNHIFFMLEDCKDLSEGKGRGFFNETLKPELREIRKTLEAYTANTSIEGIDKASACGIGFSKDNQWNLIVKVTTPNSTRLIKIDRFD
jgi:hypothetical protein